MWEHFVSESHQDDAWGIISLFSPVSQGGTALPGFAFWLRIFPSHNSVTICCHDYSLHFLHPHRLVVLSQYSEVAINVLERFGRHFWGG